MIHPKFIHGGFYFGLNYFVYFSVLELKRSEKKLLKNNNKKKIS